MIEQLELNAKVSLFFGSTTELSKSVSAHITRECMAISSHTITQ